MRRTMAALAGLILLSLLQIPTARSGLVQEGSISNFPTAYVGDQQQRGQGIVTNTFPQASFTFRNTGADLVTYSTNVAFRPTATGLSLESCVSCQGSLGANSVRTLGLTLRVTDQAQTDGYSVDVTVASSNGTLVQTLPLTVENLRSADLAPFSNQNVDAAMPCDPSARDQSFSFSIPFANIGDYGLSVSNVLFPNNFGVEATQSFGFPVPPHETVARSYRISISRFDPEVTRPGTVSVNFRDNNNVQQTRSFALNVVVTHPVNVLLPTPPAPRHDFGDVPLLTTPRSYGIFARETCGYKTGTVTLANPTQVPSFASVGGPQWNISAGSQTSISVSVRFASAHNALLYQNQSFSLQLRPSAVHPATTIVPTTYSFQARPVFINVAAFKVRLEEARGSSSFEDAREAGTMLLGLLINRTEVRPPRTEAEIADASRVVALVEPAAILIEQFDQMQTWNDEGLQQETVRALVAGAAAHQTLVAVCQSIQDAALRTQCDAALALLGDRSELFAQGAVEYFSGLNATGRSDL